jgi:hypothetical protein
MLPGKNKIQPLSAGKAMVFYTGASFSWAKTPFPVIF